MYSIEFEERVHKDIKKLSTSDKQIIQKIISKKLSTRPEIFGKPLRGTLKNLWSLRIKKFKVIYQIKDGCCIVLIV